MNSWSSTNSHLSTMYIGHFFQQQAIYWLLFKLLDNTHFLLSPRWPLWRSSIVALFYSWFYDVFHYISKCVAYLVFSVNNQESWLLFPKLKYFQVIKEWFILTIFHLHMVNTVLWIWLKLLSKLQCSTCRSLQGNCTIYYSQIRSSVPIPDELKNLLMGVISFVDSIIHS